MRGGGGLHSHYWQGNRTGVETPQNCMGVPTTFGRDCSFDEAFNHPLKEDKIHVVLFVTSFTFSCIRRGFLFSRFYYCTSLIQMLFFSSLASFPDLFIYFVVFYLIDFHFSALFHQLKKFSIYPKLVLFPRLWWNNLLCYHFSDCWNCWKLSFVSCSLSRWSSVSAISFWKRLFHVALEVRWNQVWAQVFGSLIFEPFLWYHKLEKYGHYCNQLLEKSLYF